MTTRDDERRQTRTRTRREARFGGQERITRVVREKGTQKATQNEDIARGVTYESLDANARGGEG